jgi:hypothetical protein
LLVIISLYQSGVSHAYYEHEKNINRSPFSPFFTLVPTVSNTLFLLLFQFPVTLFNVDCFLSASTCCSEFLTAVEERIDQKRQEHLVVEPEQLVNPVNVRLKKQRDQLEVLLQRLNTEVQAWQSHSNDKWDQPNVSNEISEEEVKEAEAYKQDIKNDTERPFDQMNSKIMKMAVQVEQIQHVLEQSKRTVITAETKRMQLSAQVHTAGKYSKKKTSSLIRGFLG